MPEELIFESHPAEDLLEQFALDKLAEPELVSVEEHLLLCTRCQEAVEEIDAFLISMRQAAAKLPRPLGKKQSWFSFPALWRTGGIAFAAVLLTVVTLNTSRSGSFQTVDLAATRGSASGVSARPNVPIRLSLDVTDLSQSAVYTVEVVDSMGLPAWDQRNIVPVQNRLTAELAKPLRPGQYFVRVYSNSLKSELLKEYSLLLQ